MKVFICGGGSGNQCTAAYARLNDVIDHKKPLLYIPLAMDSCMYDSCFEWITSELSGLEIPRIDMVRSSDELATKNLSGYGAIFIGGGNTFKLLCELKKCGAFDAINNYLSNDGVAFGGSAGAIIFGADLDACKLDDTNEVALQDTSGFDVLNGTSILCHYTNRATKKDAQSTQYLLELSKQRKAIALPEEVTLFVNGNTIEILGDRPYYYFENGIMTQKSDI